MTDARQRTPLSKAAIVAGLVVATVAASVLASTFVLDSALMHRFPPGPQAVELVYASAVAPAHGARAVEAHCPVGMVVTGGGTYADTTTSMALVLDNMPVRRDGTYAWRARFSNGSARDIKVGSVAVCAGAHASR